MRVATELAWHVRPAAQKGSDHIQLDSKDIARASCGC